ncbi:MAG: hypothetical protein K2Q01_00790, partial [Rickettsiales bacterium]|nr:hypothetical protein [Rickettsiales bacterium]
YRREYGRIPGRETSAPPTPMRRATDRAAEPGAMVPEPEKPPVLRDTGMPNPPRRRATDRPITADRATETAAPVSAAPAEPKPVAPEVRSTAASAARFTETINMSDTALNELALLQGLDVMPISAAPPSPATPAAPQMPATPAAQEPNLANTITQVSRQVAKLETQTRDFLDAAATELELLASMGVVSDTVQRPPATSQVMAIANAPGNVQVASR